MQTATLKYIDESSIKTKMLPVLSVRGSDTPDSLLIHGVQHRYLNGAVGEQFLGFSKRITVDFGVVQEKGDRKFLAEFLKAETRNLTYGGHSDDVVLENPEEFIDEWIDDIELGRRFILDFDSAGLYKQYPFSGTEGEIMYLKNKVEIIGTQLSPETLTTNSGKLAVDETGQAYPAFSATTHVFYVSVNGAPYQEAHVNIISKPAVSSGNITFQAAVQDGGKPAADGKFYADISIFLQAKQ